MFQVKQLGIVGNVHNWIENWLNNRKQRVVINGSALDWAPVTSCVPQGSVLGPVLFVIYINDIDLGLNSFIAKFADDTKIGYSVISDCDRQSLQKDLCKISAWSDSGKCLSTLTVAIFFKLEQEIKNMNTKWVE